MNAIRREVNGKEGIVCHVVERIRERWEKCTLYTITEGTTAENKFTIARRGETPEESGKRYTIDVSLCTCEWGEWQEHQFLCVNAMAYLKLHKKLGLSYIMKEYTETVYLYETIQDMMKMNKNMVCMETVIPDGLTLPPVVKKRSTRRPKKKRIRKRPHWDCDPEKSNIVCSRCKSRGHSIRRINETEVDMNLICRKKCENKRTTFSSKFYNYTSYICHIPIVFLDKKSPLMQRAN